MISLEISTFDGTAVGNPILPKKSLEKRWRRSSRARGGDWSGSTTISEADGVGVSALVSMAQNWLGHVVQERFKGAKTWRGRITEMVLTFGGASLQFSLDSVANCIEVRFQEVQRGDVYWTTQQQDSLSIKRYGALFSVVERGEYMDLVQATAVANAILERQKTARPLPSQISTTEAEGVVATLKIVATGITPLLDRVPVIIGYSADYLIANSIKAVLTNQDLAPYVRTVKMGDIRNLGTTAPEQTDGRNGVWTVLERFVAAGETPAHPYWIAGTFGDNRFDYRPADEEEAVFLLSLRDGQVRSRLGVPAPLLRPGGFCFIEDFGQGQIRHGRIWEDERMMWVNELEYDNATGLVYLYDGNGGVLPFELMIEQVLG